MCWWFRQIYSFQNYHSRWLLMFLYQGCYLYTEKEASFLTSWMAIFGLTATSMFEIWTPAWSSATTNRFKRDFFSYLDRTFALLWACFFFFSFFTKGFLPLFDFCFSNDFSLIKESPWVNFVKCAMWANYENNMKIESLNSVYSNRWKNRFFRPLKVWSNLNIGVNHANHNFSKQCIS